MKQDITHVSTRLSDYKEPEYFVETVELTFKLNPEKTRVISKVLIIPNPERGKHPLILNGHSMELLSAKINGEALPQKAIHHGTETLTIDAAFVPDDAFIWECETLINPKGNTALEGLYLSNGMYCTQCEAEGFRKITYYPDRPDVMAKFKVRIESDLPVRLSNGNKIAEGDGWTEWEDPWPKPSYLFALVAGELVKSEDHFTTQSGRDVTLQIWVRTGDETRCGYAMDSLKRSMRWDEQEYGREYDLDLFMIVAVDDFNMGAMENKGLNIFNSRLVLASPETATDRDYAAIEAVIAHEYFHNWTGNRITCRDWFQLCLKEGLTVFRDQQFSAHERSEADIRINEVIDLKKRQFPEDAGPLSHPVRPEEYIEINNFYTSTVYEKGAEVVRMLRTILGPETYRKALDLYFERHDGEAATIEDWLKVFEDVSGRDLTQFKLWYQQAGTPSVTVDEAFENGVYRLKLTQTLKSEALKPQLIPLSYGLLGENGGEIEAGLIELDQESFTLTRELPTKPVLSLNRNFSAPVIITHEKPDEERLFLIKHDTDPFNRFQECDQVFTKKILAIIEGDTAFSSDLSEAIRSLALDPSLDPALKANALSTPSYPDIVSYHKGVGLIPDPEKIVEAGRILEKNIALTLQDKLEALYADMQIKGPYSPDAVSDGKRRFESSVLGWLTALDPEARVAKAQFTTATDMTRRLSALSHLVYANEADEALEAFYQDWKGERLSVDKWLAVQITYAPAEKAYERVQALLTHEAFQNPNPNRWRALIGAFAQNPAAFHHKSGQGYQFYADRLLEMDQKNPQIAARLSGLFQSWRDYDTARQAHARAALEKIANAQGLSKDLSEMVGRMLAM